MSKMIRDAALIRDRLMKGLGTGGVGRWTIRGTLPRWPGKFPVRTGEIPCSRAKNSLLGRAGNLAAPH
jgi:hypothetical protein